MPAYRHYRLGRVHPGDRDDLQRDRDLYRYRGRHLPRPRPGQDGPLSLYLLPPAHHRRHHRGGRRRRAGAGPPHRPRDARLRLADTRGHGFVRDRARLLRVGCLWARAVVPPRSRLGPSCTCARGLHGAGPRASSSGGPDRGAARGLGLGGLPKARPLTKRRPRVSVLRYSSNCDEAITEADRRVAMLEEWYWRTYSSANFSSLKQVYKPTTQSYSTLQ